MAEQNETARDAAQAAGPAQALPDANADAERQAAGSEYPGLFAEGASLPGEVTELREQGMGLLEACRLYDLRQTKRELESLHAQLEAVRANHANADASTGSAAGGAAYEKDYFTPQEWDSLPRRVRDKFIRNGRIFDFMKKWSGEQ